MRCLCAHLNRQDVDTYALVLSASGLSNFHVKGEPSGWSIRVAASDFEAALCSLRQYCLENPASPPAEAPPFPEGIKTTTAVWVSLLLLSSFLAAGGGEGFRGIAELCGASAEGILNGEVYRTATALMLHATPAHLAGNIVGLCVFGTAVCAITGAGVGWLMILLTGVGGNLANAFLFQAGHLSVGASTAVFGAVGILAACQFQRKRKLPDKSIKAWLPLAGGIALLGFLGAGAHTDLTAHLFGFATGLITGLAYARFVPGPLGNRYQAVSLMVAIGILAGSWCRAYFQS